MTYSHKYIPILFLLALLLLPGDLSARTGGNLYRIMMDERGRPIRLIFVRSLREKDPEDFLMERLGYDSPTVSRGSNSTIFYDRRREGEIPILCFHRIGEDPHYELSLNRVHHLMAVLQAEGFYPISDRDFAAGNFHLVPSGMKPIVMGADDAAATQIIWNDKTMAAYSQEQSPSVKELDPDCLASLFARYFPSPGDRYNFTFYVSFDAIPFRQIGPDGNPGFPYEGIRVVRDKLRLVRKEFYLGHHSLTHTFREEMTGEAFIREVEETNRIVSSYLGSPVKLETLAYPYGSGRFTQDETRELLEAVDAGRFPPVAFDLNGRFSGPPWSEGFESWNINRFSVENSSFDLLLKRLSSPFNYQSRRVLLIRSPDKNLRLESYDLNPGGDDIIYVYIP